MSRPAHNDGEIVKKRNGETIRRKFRVPATGKGRLQIGNPGPRPNQWREFCVWISQHPNVLKALERELTKATGNAPFKHEKMFQFIVEQGQGKARQQIEVTGEDGGPVALEVIRAELKRKILGATRGEAKP